LEKDTSQNNTHTWKENGLKLFQQRLWLKAADAFEKMPDNLRDDRQALAYLGVCYLRLGKADCAVKLFERIRPPIPALAAANWAVILAHEQKYTQALQVLVRTDQRLRTKSTKEGLETIACILLKDILSVISNARDPESLTNIKKGRLLRSFSLSMSPFLHALRTTGRLLVKFKFHDGQSIQMLADNFHQLCWVYGLPIKPDFIQDYIALGSLKSYERSKEVYRDIFLSYLDYWIQSKEDISDLLLASQKPVDAHALYCIVREKRPSVVLEVGTFVGFSTAIIAQALKDNGKGIVYCVDPNVEHLSVKTPLLHAERMVKNLKLDSHVRIYEGFFSEPRQNCSSNIAVLGRSICDMVPPVDLAFIDGDHATTALLEDFMLLFPALASVATVIFHDVKTWSSVRKGILTIFQDDLWMNQMRYSEFVPSGIDGLAVVEVNKKAQV